MALAALRNEATVAEMAAKYASSQPDLRLEEAAARRRGCDFLRLSNMMDTSFCLEALEDALRRGRPEIFNTDQGAQFTSAAFTDRLETAGMRISMDGRGRWLDNVFVERLWRSLKYEEVHLKAYANGLQARIGIGQWFRFNNKRRRTRPWVTRLPQRRGRPR